MQGMGNVLKHFFADSSKKSPEERQSTRLYWSCEHVPTFKIMFDPNNDFLLKLF